MDCIAIDFETGNSSLNLHVRLVRSKSGVNEVFRYSLRYNRQGQLF